MFSNAKASAIVLSFSVAVTLSTAACKGTGTLDGGSEIKSEETQKELVKKYEYDKPLPLDLKNFRSIAREELTKIFGTIDEKGSIYQKDRPAKEGACFFDQNRVYYLTEVDSSKYLLGTEWKAAFVVSTLGEAFAGFGRIQNVGTRGDEIFYAFPSYMVGLKAKSTREERQKAVDALVGKLEKIAPDLVYETASVLTPRVTILSPSMKDGTPLTADTFLGLSKVIDFLKTYKDVETMELNGEGGEFFGAGKLRVFDETKGETIDLNQLRDVSLARMSEGLEPCNGTKPHLAEPFQVKQDN